MQVTTLNKIINLLLVGTFALILLTFRLVYYFKDCITKEDIERLKFIVDSIGVPAMTVFATFAFLSVGILLGVISDSVVQLLFERVLIKAYKYKTFRFIFQCNKRYDQQDKLLKNFEQEFNTIDKYDNLSGDENLYNAYSVAIFFHTANKENIEWAVQHYSFYLLSLNYLFIFCCIFIATLFTDFPYQLWVLVIVFICIYILGHQAINKYLYSYEVAFRHSTIILSEEKLKQGEESKEKG